MTMTTIMTSPFRSLGIYNVAAASADTKLFSNTTFLKCHRGSQFPRAYAVAILIRCFDGSRSSSTFNYCKEGHLGYLTKPISATGSGLEASITDPKENVIHIKNAKIVAESQDDEKIQIRVDLTGEETQIVFDRVLTNLARTAPPVPGFRRQKGGKTTKVPKDFLLQMLGEERVTKFVIQEIVTSTLADYAKKENLTVKDNKISTIQTAEELRSLFAPGNEFGFNATSELEKATTETSSSSTPES